MLVALFLVGWQNDMLVLYTHHDCCSPVGTSFLLKTFGISAPSLLVCFQSFGLAMLFVQNKRKFVVGAHIFGAFSLVLEKEVRQPYFDIDPKRLP
jgi:hypothetical protein